MFSPIEALSWSAAQLFTAAQTALDDTGGGGGNGTDGGNGTSPGDKPGWGGPPPGSGPRQRFDGPWFSTQLMLSVAIGVSSFLLFCFLRTRWEVVYMGRTKLKDFAPAPAHSPDMNDSSRFLGWILPTLRTSEYTVLQTVGLDAVVLLNFFRMSFMLFSLAAFLAAIVLMPLNLFRNGSTDSPPDSPEEPNNATYTDGSRWSFNHSFPYPRADPSDDGGHGRNGTLAPPPTLSDLILDPYTSTIFNLLFTFLFSFLVISFLHRNFHRFLKARQSFSLQLIHSISARTVLVRQIPTHLRGDRQLADYFEECGWNVESVAICREVEPVRRQLERRTNALLKLEEAWVEWVGNPSVVARKEGYAVGRYNKNRSGGGDAQRDASERSTTREGVLITGLEDSTYQPDFNGTGHGSQANTDTIDSSHTDSLPVMSNGAEPNNLSDPHILGPNPNNVDLEATSSPHAAHIHTSRPRPTYRPHWFGNPVDAIEYWEKEFDAADAEVRRLRREGAFGATACGFVTFEDVKSAQMACQVVHYPQHSQLEAEPAPEPRDVVWNKIAITPRERIMRSLVVMSAMTFLLLFWAVPVSALASLLSYEEIKKLLPWLARIISTSPRLAAIVQNSLPSLALITFNGVLPFLLSWLSYEQGFTSRSGTEYSLMRKYHLFLLFSVLFIFLSTTLYLALIRDLADSPMKIPEKLAAGLQGANARNFMVSYVMLQALGLMPLQLLNLGPLFTIGWARGFSTKTPRDYAAANAPPQLNYGWVYPQALLVFTITLVYSVVSPLILVFGAIYFGVGYLVYKYKLLFIYFKPYESNGEAWLITFRRLVWALVIFQLFMTGLFSLSHFSSPVYYVAMVPLLAYTVYWTISMMRDFGPLSRYTALSSICEVQRGEGGVVLDQGGMTSLNHKRYAMNDETLYVAPSSRHTDYSQPPLNNFYYGVLNTGRRRYAHPALSGSLPTPWLPQPERERRFGDGAKARRGVVLSLRRKMGKGRRGSTGAGRGTEGDDGDANGDVTPEDGEEGRGDPEVPPGWATGMDGRDAGSGGKKGTASPSNTNVWGDNNESVEGMTGSRTSNGSTSSSNINPWATSSFDNATKSKRGGMTESGPTDRSTAGAGGGNGVRIAIPSEENVWGDDDSDDAEAGGQAEVASPVSLCPCRAASVHGKPKHQAIRGSSSTWDGLVAAAPNSDRVQTASASSLDSLPTFITPSEEGQAALPAPTAWPETLSHGQSRV